MSARSITKIPHLAGQTLSRNSVPRVLSRVTWLWRLEVPSMQSIHPRTRTISRTVVSAKRSFSAYAPRRAEEKLIPPEYLDDKEREVFVKLVDALSPTKLAVQDVSGGCGSMYAVEIASPKFKGLTMIKQHRMVQEVLGEMIKGWHGLQLKTKAE